MTDPLGGERWRAIEGDCRDVLKTLAPGSVRCCVTSPPYWRQRDYGAAGQIGLEATPEEFVARLVTVFAEVGRVLADDGTLWLNLGDCWSGAAKASLRGQDKSGLTSTKTQEHSPSGLGRLSPGYKPKDLVGIPWMTAFALRADGWFLRQCNIWAKPNTMPESVRDRSTVSHEYVFMLTKRADYFYNADAARTPMAPTSETRLAQDVNGQTSRANAGRKTNGPMRAVSRLTGSPHGRHVLGENLPEGERRDKQRGHSRRHAGFNDRWDAMTETEQQSAGANLRSVWWIAPAQSKEAHFAVMPDRLARICILCSTEPGDVVLDPFAGTGTTGAVAVAEGRRFLGVELDPDYCAIARRRIAEAAAQGNLFTEAKP